jgi:hypothetical protein
MGCVLCTKIEKAAEPDKDYLCSSCVAKLSTMDREKMREFIDKLYLSDKVEKAEFVEKFVTGCISTARVVSPTLLKRRIVAYKSLKPRIF